ncbi:hypothetical protein AYK61_25810 [Rhodococcus sp. SBT000017]|uniref:ParB/Srx family N-terminal domain-containing protein n=1 Tax=Rhodococcus sp. SBT000017 TaxID=1803385 RepID=UPI000EF90292|nr:ParB/Srx family N-terminal domain-containing protein [Rhodococcus sp. SBT000017]RMB70156.1 hypothetical protein AYK61_25810 [Rhodococcus sp. SBT000017]
MTGKHRNHHRRNEAPTTGTTPVVGRARSSPACTQRPRSRPNVRDKVDTDSDEFRAVVASITDHGVLLPILARRDGDRVVVIDGQVRTSPLAKPRSTVCGADPSDCEQGQGPRNRTPHSAGEHQRPTHRAHAGQRAKAVTEMLDLGVSVDEDRQKPCSTTSVTL